jgi:hypothetical protein
VTIQYKDVFAVLAHAEPRCPVTEDDMQEPLPYLRMQELLSFVCQRADLGYSVEADRFGALLEKLVSEGDNDVRDLVIDALDGLGTCRKKVLIASRFGQKTWQLWMSMPNQGR